MPHRSAVVELLRELGAALARYGARWYLFGAQASMVWGRPRLSADVDATVEVPNDDWRGLLSSLQDAGFTLRLAEDVDAFVARTRVLPLVHQPSRLPLDVVLAGSGLEEEFLSRVVVIDFEGIEVPVLSPEDLIVTKLLAGRAKDLEDIRGILDERLDRLELERLRSTLRELERALDRSDLTPLLDAEIARRRDR